MPDVTRPRTLLLTTVLPVALLVRVLLFAAVYLQTRGYDAFYNADSSWYLQLARELAERGRFWSGESPELIRTPGYPLLLVPGLWTGHVEAVTIAVQIALSCATCVLVYLTARRLTVDERAAALAALLYAVEPLGVLHSVLLLSETLFTLLLTAALYLLVAALPQRSLARFALAAMCLAAAAYVRPVTYFLPLVLALAVGVFGALRKERRLLAGAVLLCALSFGLTTPWQVRNARVAAYTGFSAVGDFNAYFHLTAALKARREGRPFYECLDELGFYDRETYLRRHPEQRDRPLGERFRFMRQAAFDAARSDPRAAAVFYAQGLAVSYADPGAIEYLRLFDLYPRKGRLLDEVVGVGLISTFARLVVRRPLVVASNLVFGLLLAACYLFAAWGVRQEGRRAAALLLSVAALYLALASGGTIGSARLRTPVMPILCALSAGALACARRRLRARHGRAGGLGFTFAARRGV